MSTHSDFISEFYDAYQAWYAEVWAVHGPARADVEELRELFKVVDGGLAPNDLERIEAARGHELPPDFRSFIARLGCRALDVAGVSFEPTLGPDAASGYISMASVLSTKLWLPFATASDSTLYAIDVRAAQGGAVFNVDPSQPDLQHALMVAGDFAALIRTIAEFLRLVIPSRTRSRPFGRTEDISKVRSIDETFSLAWDRHWAKQMFVPPRTL